MRNTDPLVQIPHDFLDRMVEELADVVRHGLTDPGRLSVGQFFDQRRLPEPAALLLVHDGDRYAPVRASFHLGKVVHNAVDLQLVRH